MSNQSSPVWSCPAVLTGLPNVQTFLMLGFCFFVFHFFFGLPPSCPLVGKTGTTSLAHWMNIHPTLRWIFNMGKLGQEGAEAHIFDNKPKNWHKMMKAGRYGEYGVTAPIASETDRVIDCECSFFGGGGWAGGGG